ncbi:hypothetical protein CIT29_29585 [Klebsiella pneumoniae]|nr:hypothetical protein CIT29_29585 [Klebsiella pneumoniae]PXZ99598.1 hypothetical protein DMW43_27470 [Serratia marcescens]PYA16612.1 hypothetical protein DMW41_28000 [Serratia marcescens]
MSFWSFISVTEKLAGAERLVFAEQGQGAAVKVKAGRFSVADMASLNLDGCTLSLFREDKPFGPGKFLGD